MILIAGFPYVRREYLETFDAYPKKDSLIFLLPKIWKAKSGKVIFYPPEDSRIISAKSFFYHSHYPIIGGLLKGWMPSFPFHLFHVRKKVQLVYSCSEPILLTTLYQGLFTKLMGKKHILFSWENITFEEKFKGFNLFVKKMIIKANIHLSDGVICGNEKGVNIYRKFTNKPIAMIPMSGVDSNFFRKSDGLKKFREEDWSEKVVFSFAGAIGYRKGIHLIIKAFPEVLKELPQAHLVIAGSGEYENEINNLIKETAISSVVTRIPWLSRNEMKELLGASDVFVYPSLSFGGWEEQFGYSMVEASLMELPVITTRSGSIEDVVKNRKTGIIIEPNDANKLRDVMLELGNNQELRKELGINGREYATEQFSHNVITRKFYNFFSSIIEV